MALTMDCINVFYQPNDLILLLSIADVFFLRIGKTNVLVNFKTILY